MNCLPKKSACLLTAMLMISATAHSAILLQTGFDGTTLGGSPDMDGITYSTAVGLTGPTSLDDGAYAIFDTADATGHFAPNVQVNNGSWDLSFSMLVGASDINLTAIELDRRHFNGNGLFNGASGKSYPITVSLSGSSSGSLGSVTLDPVSWAEAGDPAVTETFDFTGQTALAGETLSMLLTVGDGDPANNGIFVGFDGFAVNGTVVPEPSSAALLLLGGLAFLRRRR